MYEDELYSLLDSGGQTILRCKHLVNSVGFSPDPNILPNLHKCTHQIRDSTVLIRGFSDTANMFVSRLMLNNNQVVVVSNHCSTLDKMSDLGIREEDGSTRWIPFDQTEPFHYLMDHNEM